MVSTCFGLRPSSGSLQLSLTKFTLILKHSVRLRCNLLCGGVAACPSMACVLFAVYTVIKALINVHLLVNELCEYRNARCNDKIPQTVSNIMKGRIY